MPFALAVAGMVLAWKDAGRCCVAWGWEAAGEEGRSLSTSIRSIESRWRLLFSWDESLFSSSGGKFRGCVSLSIFPYFDRRDDDDEGSVGWRPKPLDFFCSERGVAGFAGEDGWADDLRAEGCLVGDRCGEAEAGGTAPGVVAEEVGGTEGELGACCCEGEPAAGVDAVVPGSFTGPEPDLRGFLNVNLPFIDKIPSADTETLLLTASHCVLYE